MDKLALREIAKRWAKGVLLFGTETGISFGDLTEDECAYIQTEVGKIAERITELPAAHDTQTLVKEYYTLD